MKTARELRALAIRQPFSWAVCAGVKTVENRTWSTPHRGTIAVHASTDHRTVLAFRRETECEVFTREWFRFGAIIGLVDVVDVESYGPSHENDPFACGPYCWKLANGRFLRDSIPFKGKLNLFKLSTSFDDHRLAPREGRTPFRTGIESGREWVARGAFIGSGGGRSPRKSSRRPRRAAFYAEGVAPCEAGLLQPSNLAFCDSPQPEEKVLPGGNLSG